MTTTTTSRYRKSAAAAAASTSRDRKRFSSAGPWRPSCAAAARACCRPSRQTRRVRRGRTPAARAIPSSPRHGQGQGRRTDAPKRSRRPSPGRLLSPVQFYGYCSSRSRAQSSPALFRAAGATPDSDVYHNSAILSSALHRRPIETRRRIVYVVGRREVFLSAGRLCL